tara:strand:- start:143 stop:646 length:504 start_codon:yes stop_codon:yes gene_type:complete
MEWDAFIAVAQIVAGAGTFIVALFLAFQLLLQHRDAQRELTLDVSAQLERFRLTIGSDPSVAELWDRGRNDFEELTNQVERTQFYFLAATFVNHFALLEDFGGLMKYDTEPLLFRSLATNPGVRKMYRESSMKIGLPTHFTKKVEEVIRSIEKQVGEKGQIRDFLTA